MPTTRPQAILSYRTPTAPRDSVTCVALRWLASAAFIGTGIKHFTNAEFFRAIIPPGFPNPAALVSLSGICEIAGAVGLLIRPLRRAAGWGLIALLIAVFPANIYMAVAPNRIPNMHFPRWILWGRLPLQAVFIAWVWFVAIKQPINVQRISTAGKDNAAS